MCIARSAAVASLPGLPSAAAPHPEIETDDLRVLQERLSRPFEWIPALFKDVPIVAIARH